jgi:hypothetical protein
MFTNQVRETPPPQHQPVGSLKSDLDAVSAQTPHQQGAQRLLTRLAASATPEIDDSRFPTSNCWPVSASRPRSNACTPAGPARPSSA